MRKVEQRLWDRMRQNLGLALRLERQENLVSVGDPDLTCTAPRNWVTRIELKAVEDFPKRASTPVLGNSAGLSVAQRNWHMEHRRAGGISYVLVGVGSHTLFTLDGALHDSINSMIAEEMQEHSMANDWVHLRALLDPSWKGQK